MFNGIIPASLYSIIYIVFIAVLTLLSVVTLYPMNSEDLYNKKKGLVAPISAAIILIFFLGLRPLSGRYFGDMQSYNTLYLNFAEGILAFHAENDVLFRRIMFAFSQVVKSTYFFLFIEFIYIAPLLIASIRLSRENASPIFVFIISAMSFYGYATNGIRAGAAASIFVLALTFLKRDYKNIFIYILLCIAAFGFHNSMAIPIMASLGAFFIRNPKLMFYFWGVALLVSLFAGGAVTAFFSGLGFDVRLGDYLSTSNYENTITKEGIILDQEITFDESFYKNTIIKGLKNTFIKGKIYYSTTREVIFEGIIKGLDERSSQIYCSGEESCL